MKRAFGIIAMFVAFAVALATSVVWLVPDRRPTPAESSKMYVPIVLAYEGGTYIGLKEFEAPTNTQAECQAKVANEIAQIKDSAPPDAVLEGICPAIGKANVPSPEQPTITRHRAEQDGSI